MKQHPRREALIGPLRGQPTLGRRIAIALAGAVVALVLGVAGILYLEDIALLDRPRNILRGVLTNVTDGINRAAIPETSQPRYVTRPGVPPPAVAAMIQQVVDSIENTRRPLRERYSIDQPTPQAWLTPEYLLAASGFGSIRQQFQDRIAYATEVERTAPKVPDIERALRRIFESRESPSEGLFVAAVESYVIWSVGDARRRSNMAEEARDAIELHGMLLRYEGSLGWDSASGQILHPDATVAARLNTQLDLLWPERPAPRRPRNR